MRISKRVYPIVCVTLLLMAGLVACIVFYGKVGISYSAANRCISVSGIDMSKSNYDRTVMNPVQSYTKNTWYEIKLVINTDTSTCDLYINDVKKANQILLRKALLNVDKIYFFTNNSTKGSLYFDNVKVYQ